MRRPATFSRFALAACYAVGVVQVAASGLVVLIVFGSTLLTASKSGFQVPAWLLPLDLGLSVAAVVGMWVAYQRGDLDEVEVRRHRQRRR